MKTNTRKRKQFQAAEKVSIIRQHLIDKQSVSDICDEYGIAPSVYYRWQKQYRTAAMMVHNLDITAVANGPFPAVTPVFGS
ncbi:MAG: transposase [Anaerolineae bacterium]